MKALDSILLSTRPILITPWSISCSLWQEYLRSYDDDNYLDESWMDEYNLLHVLRISRWGCPHRQIKNLGITTNTHPLTRNNRVVFLLLTCICLGPVQTAVSLCQNARCIGQNARCPVPIFAVSTCAALFCSTLAVGGIPPTTCTFPHPPILIRSTKTQLRHANLAVTSNCTLVHAPLQLLRHSTSQNSSCSLSSLWKIM